MARITATRIKHLYENMAEICVHTGPSIQKVVVAAAATCHTSGPKESHTAPLRPKASFANDPRGETNKPRE